MKLSQSNIIQGDLKTHTLGIKQFPRKDKDEHTDEQFYLSSFVVWLSKYTKFLDSHKYAP